MSASPGARTRRTVRVGDAALDVDVVGRGEPVLVIQTALDADELLPLARRLAASGRHQVLHQRRRGYGASGPAARQPSVVGDAEDCEAVLAALGAEPAHVVGASYSAAVALTLASTAPRSVRTLTVVEPPPVHVRSGPEFRAANRDLVATARRDGPAAAVDRLMTALEGADWRQRYERDRPGAIAAIERDAAAFVQHDVPALLGWAFGADEARRVRCPVLHVGGSASGPWFDEVRSWVTTLLPQAECATVEGAGHLLASSHPAETARAVGDFLARHAARASPA